LSWAFVIPSRKPNNSGASGSSASFIEHLWSCANTQTADSSISNGTNNLIRIGFD
jgi:hypothetical protein